MISRPLLQCAPQPFLLFLCSSSMLPIFLLFLPLFLLQYSLLYRQFTFNLAQLRNSTTIKGNCHVIAKNSVWVVQQMKTMFPSAILVQRKYPIITMLSSEEGTSKITTKKQEALFIIWGWETGTLVCWLVFACYSIIKNITVSCEGHLLLYYSEWCISPVVLLFSVCVFSALKC